MIQASPAGVGNYRWIASTMDGTDPDAGFITGSDLFDRWGIIIAAIRSGRL